MMTLVYCLIIHEAHWSLLWSYWFVCCINSCYIVSKKYHSVIASLIAGHYWNEELSASIRVVNAFLFECGVVQSLVQLQWWGGIDLTWICFVCVRLFARLDAFMSLKRFKNVKNHDFLLKIEPGVFSSWHWGKKHSFRHLRILSFTVVYKWHHSQRRYLNFLWLMNEIIWSLFFKFY